MEISLFGFDQTIEDFEASLQRAVDEGFATYWTPQIFGMDALTAIAVAARAVPGIRVGTSVIPTYPRHPMMLAQQALTTQAAIDGRLLLGIGLSHQPVVEGMWGMSFDRPVAHMRDYLEILTPLLHKRRVSYAGETLTGRGEITPPPAEAPPVLVAALGPQMLRLAGRVADGTITWMTGPATIAELTAPTITAAAHESGRSSPAVVVGLPVCVTNDVDAARARADRDFAIYGQLPSYRAMLDREGAATPADVAIIGDATEVADRIGALAGCGATVFAASLFGDRDEQEASREVLVSLQSN
jgi:5,10-methylenetetrahydromethanopterin reductase